MTVFYECEIIPMRLVAPQEFHIVPSKAMAKCRAELAYWRALGPHGDKVESPLIWAGDILQVNGFDTIRLKITRMEIVSSDNSEPFTEEIRNKRKKMLNENYHNPLCSKAIGLPCDCGTEHNVGHMFKGPVPPGADNVIVGTYKCMGRDCTGYIMESTDIDYTTNVSSNAVGRTYFRVKT